MAAIPFLQLIAQSSRIVAWMKMKGIHQVAVRERHVGTQFHCSPVRSCRRIKLAPVFQHIAKIVVRFGILWVEELRLLIGRNGLIQAPKVGPAVAESYISLRMRLQSGGALKGVDGFAESVCIDQGMAEIQVSFRCFLGVEFDAALLTRRNCFLQARRAIRKNVAPRFP